MALHLFEIVFVASGLSAIASSYVFYMLLQQRITRKNS